MRRRPIRPFRRPTRIRHNHIQQNPLLLEAHALFRAGDFGQAGLIYLDLAKQAEIHNLPITTDLFIRVAVCQIRLEKYDEATNTIVHAFEWLRSRKRYRKIGVIFDNFSRRLMNAEQKNIVLELDRWINDNISTNIRNSDTWTFQEPEPRNTDGLPAHCTSCGAPINPTGLKWFDGNVPICEYCDCIVEMKQVE